MHALLEHTRIRIPRHFGPRNARSAGPAAASPGCQSYQEARPEIAALVVLPGFDPRDFLTGAALGVYVARGAIEAVGGSPGMTGSGCHERAMSSKSGRQPSLTQASSVAVEGVR